MFLGDAAAQMGDKLPTSTIGTGEWADLSGLLAPKSEIDQMASDISNGTIGDIEAMERRFADIHLHYAEYLWNYAYSLALDYYSLDTITSDDIDMMVNNGNEAHAQWLSRIRKDAEKEYRMGDVTEQALADFLATLQ